MRLITTTTLLASILGHAYADDGASSLSAASSEVAAIRTFFYTGGGYADDGAGGHIYREQMYVERLQPAKGVSRATPIVFIHGQAQTGTVSCLYSCIHNHHPASATRIAARALATAATLPLRTETKSCFYYDMLALATDQPLYNDKRISLIHDSSASRIS